MYVSLSTFQTRLANQKMAPSARNKNQLAFAVKQTSRVANTFKQTYTGFFRGNSKHILAEIRHLMKIPQSM